jgi:hypothetical protein
MTTVLRNQKFCLGRFDGGGPLRRRRPALGCSANEEEESINT